MPRAACAVERCAGPEAAESLDDCRHWALDKIRPGSGPLVSEDGEADHCGLRHVKRCYLTRRGFGDRL